MNILNSKTVKEPKKIESQAVVAKVLMAPTILPILTSSRRRTLLMALEAPLLRSNSSLRVEVKTRPAMEVRPFF